MPDDEHEIRWTIYVKTYGHKAKCVRSIGQTLARVLYTAFGDNFRLVDHRSQLVEWDKNKHDWGFGET